MVYKENEYFLFCRAFFTTSSLYIPRYLDHFNAERTTSARRVKEVVKIEVNPSLHSFCEYWSALAVIKQATRIKRVGEEAVVCLNVEILKDVVVEVDVIDRIRSTTSKNRKNTQNLKQNLKEEFIFLTCNINIWGSISTLSQTAIGAFLLDFLEPSILFAS